MKTAVKLTEQTLDKFICLSAILWLLGFYFFIYKVQSKVGHWPIPHNPDPKSITDFEIHFILLHFSFYFLFWLILVRLVKQFKSSWRLLPITCATLTVGFLALILGGVTVGKSTFVISAILFLVFSFFTFAHFLWKRQFGFNSSILQISLLVFWLHNFVDPFRFVEWFLD